MTEVKVVPSYNNNYIIHRQIAVQRRLTGMAIHSRIGWAVRDPALGFFIMGDSLTAFVSSI